MAGVAVNGWWRVTKGEVGGGRDRGRGEGERWRERRGRGFVAAVEQVVDVGGRGMAGGEKEVREGGEVREREREEGDDLIAMASSPPLTRLQGERERGAVRSPWLRLPLSHGHGLGRGGALTRPWVGGGRGRGRGRGGGGRERRGSCTAAGWGGGQGELRRAPETFRLHGRRLGRGEGELQRAPKTFRLLKTHFGVDMITSSAKVIVLYDSIFE